MKHEMRTTFSVSVYRGYLIGIVALLLYSTYSFLHTLWVIPFAIAAALAIILSIRFNLTMSRGAK